MGLAGTGLGGPARPGLHLSAVWPADLDAGLRNRVGAVSAGDGQGTVQIGLSHDLWLDGLGLVIRELELFLPVHAVFDPPLGRWACSKSGWSKSPEAFFKRGYFPGSYASVGLLASCGTCVKGRLGCSTQGSEPHSRSWRGYHDRWQQRGGPDFLVGSSRGQSVPFHMCPL
ncbi:hypothetical protein MRX96_058204 [Rhipicephalus microplus]